MLYQGHTLKHLKKAIDSFIEICGEDAIAATTYIQDGKITIIEDHQLELVYINSSGEIVGTEADEYVLKPGEYKAVHIL